MLDRIRSILLRECRLDPDLPVLVGVSGGPDSLCLLDLLWRLGFPVIVAHLNHQFRPEADMEADLVRQIAETLHVPFSLAIENVADFAASQGFSLEEAARTVRYHFLFQQAKRYGAQAVAVGHTANDQIETVLMHLLRGTGTSGLKGMSYRSLPTAWSQDIPLVRPLLGVWREEILAYAAERGLHPSLDSSNQDTLFFRNRLRHELIPYLQSFNPQVRGALWRTANVLREEDAILEQVVDGAWNACTLKEGASYVAFEKAGLKSQPLGVQRRLIRRAIGKLRPGLRNIDFETIERALEFLSAPPASRQIDLAAGLRLLEEGGLLWLGGWDTELPEPDWPKLPGENVLELDAPGVISLPGGWRLQAEVMRETGAARQKALENTDPFQAWINADGLRLPLQVRARCPGDRFQPLGMEGHSLKLSDYLINVQLPRRARLRWPLVCGQGEQAAGSDILWIPGFRLSHLYRLTAETRRIIHLRLFKEQ